MAREKRTNPADASKAVRRAARAASKGQSTRRFRDRSLGFPLVILTIFVLGSLLVAYAYNGRDKELRPRQLDDHWHSPYLVYDCVAAQEEGNDGFLPPFTSTRDERGVHSHSDGVIHIHPFVSTTAGRNANFNAFFSEMGLGGIVAGISEDAIVMGDGTRLEAGVDCGGEPAIIQIARWRRLTQLDRDPIIYTENLGEVRFLADGEAFTMARAPEGAELPPPPQERIDMGRQLSPQSPIDPFNPDNPYDNPETEGSDDDADSDTPADGDADADADGGADAPTADADTPADASEPDADSDAPADDTADVPALEAPASEPDTAPEPAETQPES